ncbi:deleted in malignant brain tumors 1 protein [Fundulus heteroclitus]|uniref:deleted in malignant brain tumors 1 protein n=1 Tax=Fundulus heteroclitus TaxID=8078 RepID=UPI00165A6D50|nr:deleted in malignant brain tumors 1 protein [Fundulus heteroclitus]
MMWFLLLLLHTSAHLGPVSLSDPERGRIILRGKDNPCEGHVEVHYEDKMGYVGDKNWNENTSKVVCQSTHCGIPKGDLKNVYRPLKSEVFLNELNCKGHEENLWGCDSPGLAVSFYKKPTVKKITCSRDKEASDLCKILKCNEPRPILNSKWKHWEGKDLEKMKEINCSGINKVTHPWQCVKSPSESCGLPVMISCKDHDRVQLRGNKSNVCSGKLEREKDETWESFKKKPKLSPDKLCRQMDCGASGSLTQDNQNLTCSDQVSVVLTDDGHRETKCYGRVGIKVNGTIHSVCGGDWTPNNYEMVCKELDCGTVVSTRMVPDKSKLGILDHVDCTGKESSLWHCRAKHHKAQCSDVPFVLCSGSVNVRLVDGPGVCAGRLEVQHEGRWKTAVSENWQDKHSKMVCQQLNCGDAETNSDQKFAKGNEPSLTLTCNGKSSISDCIKDAKKPQGSSNKYINITCTEHKVFILNGNEACSGSVQVKHGKEFHWLSGSNHTWSESLANEICQELHCGNASLVKTTTNPTSKVPKSLNCSFGKSLYECDLQDSDDNQTIASVKCEGKITMKLSNGCWGTVQIWTKSKNGLVSADIWTEDMSKKLCKELSCQNEILPILFNEPRETNIEFKSLHSLGRDMNLSQYSLVETNGMFPQKPAFVVCKGSIKARFEPSRDKCSGNVQVLYEDKWLPMHKDALTEANRKKICEELNCGDSGEVIKYLGPPNPTHLIQTLNCQSNDNSLATCQDMKTEKITENPELRGLKCSGWSTVALEVEHSCEGEVVVYSKDKRDFVSSEGWTEAEGKTLCKTLKCGKYKEKKNVPFDLAEDHSLWNQSFNCTSDPESIWMCGNKQTSSVKNSTVYVKCEGEPKVALTNTGELKIDGKPVCGSQWNIEYSHRVCQELNYGNAFSYEFKNVSSPEKPYHVHCDEHNYLLGQCKRVEGKCNKGLVHIFCAESVSYKLSEKCGGKVTVKYGKNIGEVCKINIEPNFTKICQTFSSECGSFKELRPGSKKSNSGIILNCPIHVNDERYCVINNNSTQTCPSVSSDIICDGYVLSPTVPPPPPEPVDPIPIIVGVLFSLILVVLIGTFVRYLLKMRKRKSMLPPDMEEADWDSGEYEEVDKSDELGSFNRGRFRSESEGERDGESKRSYNYDDIDEVTEAQPLTLQGSMTRADEDKDMDKGVIKPSDEGVTYEVEDSQENYDDIDASPENAETTAEVHEGPRPAPEGDAEAPRDQVQKDEDYLVPGQDG